ncbi:uncharacterized protein [Arachis hypogaea]|uniref:uncharacterized protein n=1 Tax=Arachis hypogaea TaxID=3818 RepID=UPI000DECE2CE|nr:uncharacterized protein LOC112783589 [Arachis hypogaea]
MGTPRPLRTRGVRYQEPVPVGNSSLLASPPFLVLMMNIISWNCRGVGSKAFPSLIRDLRYEYGANMFFLLETHVSGARGNQIRGKIGFDSSFVMDAVGHAGGIWCLWDSSVWSVDVLEHDKQFSGGALSNNQGACKEFQDCVATCGLIDLGFVGCPYTWKRGNLAERLDRGLSNLEWQLAFPEALVKHMPMLKSDHSPICLQLSPVSEKNRGNRKL